MIIYIFVFLHILLIHICSRAPICLDKINFRLKLSTLTNRATFTLNRQNVCCVAPTTTFILSLHHTDTHYTHF